MFVKQFKHLGDKAPFLWAPNINYLFYITMYDFFNFHYSESAIVAIGNPLLDISATGTKEFLDK